MKKGPKKGSHNVGSLNEYLSSFTNVGDTDFIEIESPEQCIPLSRRISARSRYSNAIANWEFSTQSIHGVSAGKFGISVYLLKVVRVK